MLSGDNGPQVVLDGNLHRYNRWPAPHLFATAAPVIIDDLSARFAAIPTAPTNFHHERHLKNGLLSIEKFCLRFTVSG